MLQQNKLLDGLVFIRTSPVFGSVGLGSSLAGYTIALCLQSRCVTICRCHNKGSTFSSVILRPCVLVRLGFEPTTPPGGTPLYKPSAAPKGRVFAPFQSENGDTFFTFGLESSMVFEEITGVYEQICRFNSK